MEFSISVAIKIVCLIIMPFDNLNIDLLHPCNARSNTRNPNNIDSLVELNEVIDEIVEERAGAAVAEGCDKHRNFNHVINPRFKIISVITLGIDVALNKICYT